MDLVSQLEIYNEKDLSRTAIRQSLDIVCEPGRVYEGRAFDTKLGTIAGFFDDFDKLADAAWALTGGYLNLPGRFKEENAGQAPSVYITINPVNPIKLNLESMNNWVRIIPAKKNADEDGWCAADKDISVRRRFLLDYDPWRNKMAISTTEVGRLAAIQRAEDVSGYLESVGFSALLLGCSGNGGHNLGACDMPNDDAHRDLIQAFLHAIIGKFGDNHLLEKDKTPIDEKLIDIDSSVFNAARICTLYGTWKRKGADRTDDKPDNPARPHRLAHIIRSPAKLGVTPVELFKRVIDESKPENKVTVEMPGNPVTDFLRQDQDARQNRPGSHDDESNNPEIPPFLKEEAAEMERVASKVEYVRAILEKHKGGQGFIIGETKAKGVFTHIEIKPCLFDKGHKKATISIHAKGKVTYLCPHDSCKGKKEGYTLKTWGDVLTLFGEPPEAVQEAGKDEGEDKDQKVSKVRLLIDHAVNHCRIVFDPDSEKTLATYQDVGGRQTRPVSSTGFRNWLVRSFTEASGKTVKGSEVTDAILNISARYTEYAPTHRRIVRHEDAIYIDTLNGGKVVKITGTGWDIIDEAPVVFETRKDMGILPLPQRGGDVAELQNFVNVTDVDFPLYLACLMDALKGRKPYVITLVNGREGSAKTTLANTTGDLIDPCRKAKTKELPDTRYGLAVMAINRHQIMFDNMRRLSDDMSDAVCRLATGSGFTVRGLYKDDEETVFGGANPVMFNGIPELGTNTDFLQRSLRLTLPVIPEEKRRDELDMRAEFERRRPYILGALYDLLANGLRNEKTLVKRGGPRMIDSYYWLMACEAGTRFNLSGAFKDNCDRLVKEVAFDTLLGRTIQAFMESMMSINPAEPTWTGTAEQLHATLRGFWAGVCGESKRDMDKYPGNGRYLSSALEGIGSSLALNGIAVTKNRDKNGRWIAIDARNYFGVESGTDPVQDSTSKNTSHRNDQFKEEPKVYTPVEPDDEDANKSEPQPENADILANLEAVPADDEDDHEFKVRFLEALSGAA